VAEEVQHLDTSLQGMGLLHLVVVLLRMELLDMEPRPSPEVSLHIVPRDMGLLHLEGHRGMEVPLKEVHQGMELPHKEGHQGTELPHKEVHTGTRQEVMEGNLDMEVDIHRQLKDTLVPAVMRGLHQE